MSEFKYINKDTNISELEMHIMPWDVIIHNRPYYAVRIPGYVHTVGGRFGNNDYWAYPRDQEPNYNNLIEFSCDNVVCWGIKYQPHNYIKCKWDESRAQSAVSCMITRNGVDFCDVWGGLAKATVLIDMINEHPLDLNEIDFDKKMIGRKVWWRSEPGIITSWISGQGCVIIEPDGIDRFSIPSEFKDDSMMEACYEDGNVKVSIFDEHVWWFRR